MAQFTYQTAQLEEKPIKLLDEVLADTFFRSLQAQSETYQGMKPGRKWYVDAVMHDTRGIYKDVYVYGDALFRWVCNRSGATLAQGALAKFYSQTVANIDSGAVGSVTKAAQWVADEQVHNLVAISDDAGGAGAAPEGEARYIVKNTADVLTVQHNFSAAPALNDDLEIISNCMVLAAVAGDDRSEVAGVVIAPDGIPDNYWGWLAVKGRVAALLTAAAQTKGTRLIAGAGVLNDNAAPSAFEDLGFVVVGAAADLVGLGWVQLELPMV